jgi:tRNA1Val (adenine37-N6)-methyltransferase
VKFRPLSRDPDLISADWSQPEEGYRFSRDSVVLSGLLPERAPGLAADLGAGCGVVSLEALASGRLKGLEGLYLVEREEYFLSSLAANVRRAGRLVSDPPETRILFKDWRDLGPGDFPGPLDLLCANPPYTPLGRGRMSPKPRNSARMELHGDLSSLLECAGRILKNGGLFCLSLPRIRLAELLRIGGRLSFLPEFFHFPAVKNSRLALVRLSLRLRRRPR